MTPVSLPDKTGLKEELARILAADLARASALTARRARAATHEEAKPENDKDTRALEQSYLARGEALRVEELRSGARARSRRCVVALSASGDPVALGRARRHGAKRERAAFFWLAPHGGGTRLADGAVQVVTPKSPLGRALLGKRAGDECEVVLAGKRRVLCVVQIA